MCVSCFLEFALATLSKEHPQSLRGAHVYVMSENHFAVFHWHPVVRQRALWGKQEKQLRQPSNAWRHLRGGHLSHRRSCCLLNWMKAHMKLELSLAKSAGQALCLAPLGQYLVHSIGTTSKGRIWSYKRMWGFSGLFLLFLAHSTRH